jgi:uncharacterized membrane protein YphA (DoxX/SURF4 family)
MKRLQQISALLLSVLLGLVFLYSGYSKLVPIIETFEFTFVDLGIANWYSAPIFARLLIGFELFLGLLLVLNYRLRKITLPLTFIVLALFTIYLAMQVMLNGDQGNCGCFGERIKMTPVQAILKNSILAVLAISLYLLSEGWKTRFQALLISSCLMISMSLPFVINPIDYSYTSNNLDEKINYPLELDLLYNSNDTSQIEIPEIELRKGKHVVAFLSLTCSHCRIAAKKFRLIKKNNPELPVYFILNGNKRDYPDFMKDTKTENIPSSFCLGKTFVQLSSAHLPRIYYLDNSRVVKKVDYFELNQYSLEEWLKSGKR